MSDQDFFFDEDEKAAEKPAKRAGKSAATKSAPAKAAKAAPAQSSMGVELTWTTTALIAVVTLLLGVIIGYAIPKGATVSETATTPPGTVAAPQLSPEQMQSGELPEGHPDIGAVGGSTGATGSTEATGN